MIAREKRRQALHALNAVLVRARAMANEKAPHEDIAYVLDCAEYLPMLMIEDEDRTADFRQALEGLASKFADFVWAVDRFDAD